MTLLSEQNSHGSVTTITFFVGKSHTISNQFLLHNLFRRYESLYNSKLFGIARSDSQT